tara:strand:- start:122 stop:436 length:315 start_codon:yes stop_codon:yes gene_type:complete
MKKLQIGDKIYATNDFGIRSITIARLTKTLAISDKGSKFKINTDNGFCEEIPKNRSYLNRCYYQLETPELKEILQKQRLIQKLSKFDFNKLDLKTLIEINSKLI